MTNSEKIDGDEIMDASLPPFISEFASPVKFIPIIWNNAEKPYYLVLCEKQKIECDGFM